MLDGLQSANKAYKAVKVNEYEEGKAVKLTINFVAHDDADAQRFLIENGYQEYKLILEEG
ncbi:MAG: hypothetical protein ACQ9ET_02680 [Nitrosomonadaceae bacterium]